MARMSEILMSEPSMRTAVTLVVNSTSTGTNYYTLKYRSRSYVITPLDGQTSIDSATHFFRTHGVRILGWASTDDGIVLMMPYNATNRLARIFQVGR
jgi:hypothetical protein